MTQGKATVESPPPPLPGPVSCRRDPDVLRPRLCKDARVYGLEIAAIMNYNEKPPAPGGGEASGVVVHALAMRVTVPVHVFCLARFLA